MRISTLATQILHATSRCAKVSAVWDRWLSRSARAHVLSLEGEGEYGWRTGLRVRGGDLQHLAEVLEAERALHKKRENSNTERALHNKKRGEKTTTLSVP